jgi:hypothetical protein
MNFQYWVREPTWGDLIVILSGLAFIFLARKWGEKE